MGKRKSRNKIPNFAPVVDSRCLGRVTYAIIDAVIFFPPKSITEHGECDETKAYFFVCRGDGSRNDLVRNRELAIEGRDGSL